MNKVLTVARTEYFIAVSSKAFLLGIAMMPLLGGAAILLQYLTKDQVDLTPRRIAIVDQTGRLFSVIEERAEQRNENGLFSGDGEDQKQVRPEFIVESADAASDSVAIQETTPGADQMDLPGDSQGIVAVEANQELEEQLSKRVKQGELFAFAIIDQAVFSPESEASVRYHSQTPSYTGLSNWLGQVVNGEVNRVRAEDLGLSPADVATLVMQTPVRQFGLVERDEAGEIKAAKEENRLVTFAVPFGGLMLLFMMVMSVAPTMLNNVLEEKMQKISEFLVSSISPFQLMLGKLLGAIAVGLTLSSIYLTAVVIMTHYFEVSEFIRPELYVWFVFFLLLALTIFGSVFSAIGAACSEIRDAQSLMTPVMLVVVIPMLCMGPILDSPSSGFSKAMSLFPPATPMLMFARIAIPPGPATWELVLAVCLTVLFAMGCVWAAGRVFRVGILSQGQAPSLAKLVSWIFTK